MKKVVIDPSIAVVVDINSIAFYENVNIYFNATLNWIGSFDFKVWNSYQKNTFFAVNGAITIVDTLMILKIDPSNQNLVAQNYYYEIMSVDTSRIIFKGDLIIVK
jgi:hypothetical protein